MNYKLVIIVFFILLFLNLSFEVTFAATVTCPPPYTAPPECEAVWDHSPLSYSRSMSFNTRDPSWDVRCAPYGRVGAINHKCFCNAASGVEYWRDNHPGWSYCGINVTAGPCWSSTEVYSWAPNICSLPEDIIPEGNVESRCQEFCQTLGVGGGGSAVPNQTCPTDYTTTDSYIRSYDDPPANHGNDTDLMVSWWGSGDIYKGLIKFNLNSGSNPIPAGATVNSATLRVFIHGWAGNSCPAPNGVCSGFIDVYNLNRNWSENAVNWNRAQSGNLWQIVGADGVLDRDQTAIASSYIWLQNSTGYHTFDITGTVQQWVNNSGSNKGVILSPRKDNGKNNSFNLYSSESSEIKGRPCLIVDYVTPTPTPMPPTSTPTPTPTSSPTTGAWYQTTDGDVYTGQNISSGLPALKNYSQNGLGGFPGVVVYGGGSADFGSGEISSKKWLANTGFTGINRSYDYFYELAGSPVYVSPPSNGKVTSTDLPSNDGVIAFNDDIKTDGSWSIGTKKIVVLTTGNFLIDDNITVDSVNGGSLTVIVRGKDSEGGIGIDKDLAVSGIGTDKIQGIFITDNIFYSSVNPNVNLIPAFSPGGSAIKLVFDGSVIASSFSLLRDLGADNQTTPAELFRADVNLLMNYQNLWETKISWQENP